MKEAVQGFDLLRPAQGGDLSGSPFTADLVESPPQASLRRGIVLEKEGQLARPDRSLAVAGRGPE